MKHIFFILALAFAVPALAFDVESTNNAAEVSQHLQDISVTIVTPGGGEGSGIIKTRKNKDGKSVNFIWTAAHVVNSLRSERSVIDSASGSRKTVIEFADAKVIKVLKQNGRNVGKMELFAEVTRYSAEEDIALLKLRKIGFVDASVKFYLEDEITQIGTSLIHVGSLLGQMGSNSMTTGIMSQHGRVLKKKVFDQTTVAAFPGSSGGGVYLENGKLIGQVVRGAGETFNLITPVRRMIKWAKQANIEWALDDSVEMPSDEELDKLPVEDNGVTFSYSARREEAAQTEQEAPEAPKGFITFGNGPRHLGEFEKMYPTWIYFPSK